MNKFLLSPCEPKNIFQVANHLLADSVCTVTQCLYSCGSLQLLYLSSFTKIHHTAGQTW